MKKSFYLMACVATSVVGNFISAPQALAEKSIRLEDSYVHPDYIEVEQIRDTKQIIVIKKEDIIEKGYTTISDVLKDIPSINVNTTGLGDIDIRGQGGDQAARNLQVLLDGAPITTFSNHPLSSNYDVVPVEQIEKIEIIPGGGSVLYGSGASGGVINITTALKTKKKGHNTLSTEQNSDGARYNLNVFGKVNDQTNFNLAYAKLRRDLYFVDTYRNSEYMSAGAHYDVSNREALSINYSHLDEESQYIANINASKLKALGRKYRPQSKSYIIDLDKDGHPIMKKRLNYLNGDRNLDTLSLNYQKKIDDHLRISNDFFYNTGTYRNTQEDKKMDHDSIGVRFKADYNYGKKNTLLLGLDYYYQKARLEYDDYKIVNWKKKIYKKNPLHFYYDKKVRALYLLNVLKSGKYSFTQGVRREAVDWHYDKKAAKTSGKDTDVRLNTAAELSLAYHYNDTGKIYARYERGYTSPDGLQIVDDRPIDGVVQMAKTLAEDEHFNIYEIGLRDKLGISTLNLTLFASNTNNQMNRFMYLDFSAGFVRQTMNLLSTHRKGAEISLRQKMGKMTLEESYAYLRGHSSYNDEGKKFLADNPSIFIDYTRSGLHKVPRHKASVKLSYDVTDRFNFGLDYVFFGSYNNFLEDANKDTDGIVGSHALVDLNLRYKARKNMEFYGGVTNLFDKKYYENVGQGFYTLLPGRTRSIYGGMKYTF